MSTINGDDNSNTISGGTGDEVINAKGGNDSVSANGGADTVYGGAGSDTVFGGEGFDQIYGGAQGDSLYGDIGDDQIFSGTGNDQLFGGTENDSVMGQSGNDTLFGGDGNDFGSGGTGNDQIFGGTGNDSLRGDMFVISSFAPFAEASGSPTNASITNASTMSLDIYRIDSAGNPVFIGTLPPGFTWSGTANTGQTYVLTQPGTMDVIDVLPVAETSSFTFNPTFDDTIEGGDGNDTIRGEFGNDVIRGDAGNDSLFGGVGNDSLFGGADADSVFGGVGDDYVELGDGNDSFGNDTSEGGRDTIYGGAGGNIIFSGADNDLVFAGNDNDSVYAGTGDDSVFGGLGGDYVELGDGNDSFGNFNDEGGNDTVYGGAGNDSIIGGGEDDLLYGGDGNDTLSGGVGTDSAYGGAGDDIFLVTDDHQSDFIDGGTGRDYIAFGNFGTQQGVDVVFTGSDRGTYSFDGSTTAGTFENVEGIWTTEYADTVDASADANGAEIYTHGGDDVVYGGSGADSIGTGSGNDLIYANGGDDTVDGGSGNDTIHGGAGNNTLFGGAGDDVFVVDGAGTSVITGGETSEASGDQLIYVSPAGTLVVYTGDKAGTFDDGTASGSFSEIERMTFGSGDDTVDARANSAGSTYVMGDGDDSIRAGSGSDTVDGGAGADTISGGAGADLLFGGADADVIRGGSGDTVYGGEAGDDRDVLELNYADVQSITYDQGSTESGTVTFTDGSTLTFYDIEEIRSIGTVDGTQGADSIGAGFVDADSDAVDGADGNDDAIYGEGGADTIESGAGADTVYGGTGDDSVSGMTGDDSLYGGDGDDTLTGGTGDDRIEGGAGTDRAVFTGDVTGYTFDRTPNGALIVTDLTPGRDGTDTLTGIEEVTFNGVTYRLVTGDDGSNTTLQGPDDGTPSLIIAHDGNDWGGGHATSDAIFGGAGNDTLDGGDGDDTLVGEGDNDLLRGDGGNDSLLGGDGKDTLEGGAGNDTLQGGAGNDTLSGGTGSDRMEGGDDADVFVIEDGFGRDTVIGGEGGDDRDRLDMSRVSEPVTVVYRTSDGGTANTPASTGDNVVAFSEIEEFTLTEGSDEFYGGANTSGVQVDGGGGNDTIFAGQGNDTLSGGEGNDEIFGAAGNDVIDGGAGNDNLGGDEGDDTVSGGAGDDFVQGMAGDDSVSGGDGNDTVVGGQGSDTLTGGSGEDVFGLTENGGRDTVTDFDMTRVDGRTTDQLDVSDLTTQTGAPVTWRDVVVTGTNQDGTGDAVLTFPNGESVVLTGVSPEEATGKRNMAQMGIPCFATGTPILTPDGWVRIEDLGTGDLVVTQDQGAVPVLWAGGRRLSAAELRARPALCPVRISRGALGNHDSLLVSPQHGVLMLLDECDAVLVRALHLAQFGHGGFRVARGIGQVGYHHLLLPRHAVINAAGAAVESLYPGRMALSALGPVAHVEVAATLLAQLGAAELPPMGLGGLADLYGPRVAPVLTARQVQAALEAGRLRPANPWGDTDSAVA